MRVPREAPRSIGVLSAAIVLATQCSPAAAQARPMPPGSLPPISESTQAAIIDSIISVLDATYVMAGEGARMAEHLREGWTEGEWR